MNQRNLQELIDLLKEKDTVRGVMAATYLHMRNPEHHFNFAACNKVGHRADARDTILTDYLGIIRSIGNIREFGDATTNRIARRNIEIQNLNGNTITFTLWNEMAMRFEVNTCAQLEQPIIIAVTFCWAKRFTGGLQLSVTPATCHYLNPHVEEAEQIRSLYAKFVGKPPPLMLPPIDAHLQQRGTPERPMSFNALLELNPDAYGQQVFTTEAVIVKNR